MRFSWALLAAVVLVSPTSAAEKLSEPPDDAAIEKAAEQVKEIFGNDIAAAKTPSQKAVLAKKLLNTANNTSDDEAGRFVLLRAAKKLAIAGGDKSLAIEAAKAIVERWQANERDGDGGKLSAGEWLAKGDKAVGVAEGKKGEKKLAGLVEAWEDYARASEMGKGLVRAAAEKKMGEVEGGDEQPSLVAGANLYKIVNRSSGMVLTPRDNSANSEIVQRSEKRGDVLAYWKIKKVNGFVSLQNARSGKYMVPSVLPAKEGTRLRQVATKEKNNLFLWDVAAAQSGNYRIVFSDTDLCLDVPLGTKNENTPIVLWGRKDQDNQLWTVEKVRN